jgi:hypothetical protein
MGYGCGEEIMICEIVSGHFAGDSKSQSYG